MDRRIKRKIINGLMMIALIVVMVSGMLLRTCPGMWMGIIHGLSGVMLTVSVVLHCLQHRVKRKI